MVNHGNIRQALRTDRKPCVSFGLLLVSVLLILTGLSYMPVLTLGPVLEDLALF